MGRGNNSSAYRDMDEEFFTSLEEANYECHESPAKSLKLSESMTLHKHLEKRRAVRTKAVVTLSLLLAGVGTAALYTSVDASTSTVLKASEVFTGEDTPDFGDAILATDETVSRHETNYALDDAMLDELDPYDEFRQDGRQLVAK
ncbi:hypothetical protein PI126_g11247 [Phytophthora idaei]|nr:hypothetical protein PI126_g11247 [Phytophthora idaei]